MIGAIIGDIVGSRFEFNNYLGTDFELFTNNCSYTDDTICTIAIADAILHQKDYKNSLVEWCRKYPHPKGAYGARFAQWIHNPEPYNSFGNGSAMRVSPIGWAFDNSSDTITRAVLSAGVSHNHLEGIKGAECVAVLIYALRQIDITKGNRNHINKLIQSIAEDYDYTLQKIGYIRTHNSFNETCQVTVPQAISCVMEANSFEEAIRLAVSIGGDSDTIAAIAGSIAEPLFGIPAEIKEKAISYLPAEMVEIINEFYERYGK